MIGIAALVVCVCERERDGEMCTCLVVFVCRLRRRRRVLSSFDALLDYFSSIYLYVRFLSHH